MSWDSYIDTMVATGRGSCDAACIMRLDRNQITSDTHTFALKITVPEAIRIASIFISGSADAAFSEMGVTVAGIKYIFENETEGTFVFRKMGRGAITLRRTKIAVVIGHTIEGKSEENTTEAVELVAGKLESSGF